MKITLTALCGWYGISRQAHYQMKRRQEQQRAEEAVVLALVQDLRRRHKRMGTRKLLNELQGAMIVRGVKMGRDRLFELLRRHDLLVRPKRRRCRTTWPGDWYCENRLAETTVERVNQAWVSDITYVETEEGFAYLSLVTDVFSRRILGYDLSSSLAVEGTLRALSMALEKVPDSVAGLIHHSDRGIQYTCHAFRQKLAHHGIQSSMGAKGDCYDNALAERVNGILKLEYGLDDCFVSLTQARRAVKEAVWLYNHERPHLSLGFRKPFEVYQEHVKSTVNSPFFCKHISGLDSRTPHPSPFAINQEPAKKK